MFKINSKFARELFVQSGWSLHRLALKSGLPLRTVANLLCSDRVAPLKTIEKLANAFNLGGESLILRD